MGTCRLDVKGELQVGENYKKQSTKVRHRDGVVRSSVEVFVMKMEQRDYIMQLNHKSTRNGRNEVITTKSFRISKSIVFEAYKQVRKNKGAPGVDGVTIEHFEKDLSNNLYKIWNRMSSGSYFPPPVKVVDIPKGDGGIRRLGIPTVSDRIAQMVIKTLLEAKLEPVFHPDSYGYRPKCSAVTAVKQARERCWRIDWVIDLDIKGFFDNLNHELMLKALRRHTDEKWILMYVERWLKAPVQFDDNEVIVRTKGTPQGGVISPLLANLFLHYAFDVWMNKQHSRIKFERYADDVLIHCVSERQAKFLLKEIRYRLLECGLELHPLKTKIVYCKDDRRTQEHQNVVFNFLGFCFRPRVTKGRVGYFVSYNPAVSLSAKKNLNRRIQSLKLVRKSRLQLSDLATLINPIVRGWINYFKNFTKSELESPLRRIDRLLLRWMVNKYKKIYNYPQASKILGQVADKAPHLFFHWKFGYRPPIV
jgi:group II intron reverse transcriptase/maturase